MWIGRPDGVLLEYRNGSFRPLVRQTGPQWRVAVEGANGVIWLEREQRLVAWRDGRLIPPPVSAEVPDSNIRGIIPDTADGFWMGTEGQGLWHVTTSGAIAPDSSIRRFRQARPLFQSRDGTLWVWLTCLWVRRHGVWSQVEAPTKPACIQPQTAREGSDGTVWIGTRGRGLLRWRDGKIDAVDDRDDLSAPSVDELHLDGERNVWVGTAAGLDRLRAVPFGMLGPRDGLPFQAPWTLFEGAGGCAVVEPLGTSGIFRIEGGILCEPSGRIKSTLIRSTGWNLLSAANDGGLWLVRDFERLFHVRGDGEVTAAPALPRGTFPKQIATAFDGTTWLRLLPEGIGVLKNGVYSALPFQSRDAPPLETLMEGSRGSVWSSSPGSSTLIHLHGGRVSRRVAMPQAVTEITAVAASATDTLWAAYLDGIVRLVGEQTVAIPLPKMKETWRNFSGSIVVRGPDLWFASVRGIGRLPVSDLNAIAEGRKTSAEPRWFGERDGLSATGLTRLNLHPVVVASDGRLWFATTGGIAVYDARNAGTNAVAPRALVEEVSVDGRDIPSDSAVQIAPNPGRIEIHFTALALRIPERVRIEYRLDGIDRDWVASGPTRTAAYPSLSPGTYRFRVRAWNEDGVPSAAEATLGMRVLPAWNQTWWFVMLVVFCIGGFTATALIVWQKFRFNLKADRMQAGFDAILSERTRIARDLHDTLLQGFTGITLELHALSPVLRAKGGELSDALENVLQHADAALRDARQMVWDIRAPELAEQNLAQAVETAARAVIGNLPIELKWTLDGTIEPLPPAIEVAVFRIGREAAWNAVQHAAPTLIAVTLRYQKEAVTLTVLDNGRGMDPTAVSAATAAGHWGLAGMRSRAEELGGQLTFESRPSQGTRVTLELPIVGLTYA